MMFLTFYTWLVVLLLGLRTSYTDIRLGKIRNKDLLWGLVATVGFFAISFSIGVSEGIGLSFDYLWTALWNIGIGAMLAYWFWQLHIWSAGDGKLFVVFLALIPLDWYQQGYIGVFPGFVLLLNSILPLVVFLLFRLSWALVRKYRWKHYLTGFRRVPFLKVLWEIIQFVGIFLVGRFLVGIIFVPLRSLLMNWMPELSAVIPPLHDQNTIIIITLLIFMGLRRWIKASPVRNAIVTAGAFVFLLLELLIGWKTWGEFVDGTFGMLLTLAFVLVVFRVFMSSLVHFVRVEPVLISELKEGMILTPRGVQILQEKDNDVFGAMTSYADGLTEEQIHSIQEWYRTHADTLQRNESLEIYMTSAFAPFLFLGAVITGILQKGIL